MGATEVTTLCPRATERKRLGTTAVETLNNARCVERLIVMRCLYVYLDRFATKINVLMTMKPLFTVNFVSSFFSSVWSPSRDQQSVLRVYTHTHTVLLFYEAKISCKVDNIFWMYKTSASARWASFVTPVRVKVYDLLHFERNSIMQKKKKNILQHKKYIYVF